MIYFEKTTALQTVFLPADTEKASGTYSLELCSTIDQTTYTFSGLPDLTASQLLYSFALELPDGIVEGEYEYALSISDNIVARGLAIVGSYERESTNIKVYEQ